MTVGGLFSGIGGLDLGLARAGLEHLFLAESDPYRRAVLAARFPGIRIYPDVREVAAGRGGRPVPGVLGRDEARPDSRRGGARAEDGDDRPDVLAGGFPCQDLSAAGRRRGLAGERSALFFEFVRVADALRPRWLLVENVPGLLTSDGGRDFGVLLGTLAELGYGLGWRILDSRYFGVPQRRRRVFVVGAVADGDPRAAAERAGEVLAVGSRCPRHTSENGEAGEGVPAVAPDGAGSRVSGTLGSLADGGFRTTDTDGIGAYVVNDVRVRRLAPVECERLQALPDGWTLGRGASETKRYAAIGDAVTVTVAEWIGRRIVEADR